MRIRKPKAEQSDPNWEPKNDLYSITYKAETITPIYGGGVETGEVSREMPIRAAAIRGQLRYWWRFLKSHDPDLPLKGEKLYKAERAIWGGMNTNKKESSDKDYDAAGKVTIQITNIKSKGSKACGKYVRKEKIKHGRKKISYTFYFDRDLQIPEYSLFSAKGTSPLDEDKNTKVEVKLGDEVLLPGITFDLKIMFRSDIDGNGIKSVEDAVRWWVNFGGIGARTRRGLGAVKITSVKTNGNDSEALSSKKPVTRSEAADYSCCLRLLPGKLDALTSWNDAVEKLQQFRQGENVGRKPGNDRANRLKLGRSNWPEPDTIRELTELRGHRVEHKARNSFPRAMFGLPIIFDFQGARGEPPKTHLLPDRKDSSRMASPLIIKPVADGEGKYIPSALLLPPDHIEDLGLALKIDKAKKEKDKLDNKVLATFPKKFAHDVWWPSVEQEQKNKATEIEPMKNRDHDPLHAFLKFFEEG